MDSHEMSPTSEPAAACLPAPTSEKAKTKKNISRTRTGCRTCRCRRVKCDERKPVCSQCRRGKRACEWPGPNEKRQRFSKRPNATACDACRDKKLKCIGDVRDACRRCSIMGIKCMRSNHALRPTEQQSLDIHLSEGSPATLPPPLSHVSASNTGHLSPLTTQFAKPSLTAGRTPSAPVRLGELPAGKELEDLVHLYFSSVHHFGYFAFIHQLHFNRLLAKGKAPRDLTLLMIASAMRFASEATSENLARADAWADAAIGAILPRIHQGFGAIQLMTLLLAQQYDLNRGNFTSAWLLGADCTRMMQMMSLQTFDRTYPANLTYNPRLSPLLSREALRRVAWSTFYVDTIVDGGRYGFHVVDEKAYRLQLPCDQATFLSDEMVVTEPLFPTPPSSDANISRERPSLDISAYLLRTAAARRRALHFAFRASHKEQTVQELSTELAALEMDMKDVIAALPKRFYFNSDNMFLHKDQLITFILLHILRHNLFIILGRASLHVYLRDSAKKDLIPQVRRKRISHALPIAGLISEGLKAGITFDPQIGVQAYVALEILLFEPRRLAETDPSINPGGPELMEAIPHLLAAIRNLADRSEFIKQLHIEAVHRLLRCDCTHLLIQTDFTAFLSEYQLVGQDAAEYDFRDFRWAKLERLRRGASSTANVSRDEALLEYSVGGETVVPSAMPSPRLDAMDVSNGPARVSSEELPGMLSQALNIPGTQDFNGIGLAQAAQSWEIDEGENPESLFPLDWPWLLGESSHPGRQTGDPTLFWSQL